MVKRRWIQKFASKSRAKRYARGRLVMSRLIVIIKEKLKKDDRGRTYRKKKRRLILNLKRSGVTSASVKVERPELPRVLDVVFAGLNLLKLRRRARLRHIVLDFKNAFFQFPVALDEQRYFVTRLRRHIYIYGIAAYRGRAGRPWSVGGPWPSL